MFTYSKIIIAILFLITTQVYQAAQMKLEIEGDAFNLSELAAIIAKQNDKVTVVMTRKDARPPAYQNIDLLSGDVILMSNGIKIKEVKQLEEIYKNLKIGEQLKIAIKRSDKPQMISFNKADPDKLPKRRMMMKRVPVVKEANSEKNATKKLNDND